MSAGLAVNACLDVLLSVCWSGVPPTLNTAFLSANLIEDVLRNRRDATGNARRWSEKGDMVTSWIAAGLLRAEIILQWIGNTGEASLLGE